MTDGFDLLALGGNPLKRLAAWCTLEMRIVRRVRLDMKKVGYSLNSKQLRLLLYAPEFEERLASPADDKDELYAALKATLMPPEVNGAIALRRHLIRAFTERLPGSTRASNFAALQADARHTVVTAEIQAVGRNIDAMGDQTSFSYRLADMHPLRAAEFKEINSEWPLVARVVGALATTADRKALLARWATHWPMWCEAAPPALYGLLAEMAFDEYRTDDNEVAVALIERGLTNGLEPRGYWVYQVAILRGIDTVEDGAAALSEVRGYPLAEASLHPNGFPAAIETLKNWAPGTRREELHRCLLLIQLLEGVGKLHEAITLAKATAANLDSTSAAVGGARALMMRHRLSASHQSDLTEALELAVTARTDRRRWHLDSGEALATEIEIRRALSDHQGATDIVNGIGEIPATPEELRHPKVVKQAAIVHAEVGDVEVAKRLVHDLQGHKAHILALIAERESRPEEAARLWAEAIEQSHDLGDKAHLALQLAFHGIRSPIVDSLIPDNAKTARELSLVARLFANQPGALEEFRGFANADHRGTMLLYTYYRRKNDNEKAVAVAREGATRWNDPDLWLESGRHERQAGNLKGAIADIASALAAAESTWGNRATAFRHLIELHSSIDDWQEAKKAAGHLLAAEPESSVAIWAMIICQLHTNDLPGALTTWQSHGSPAPTSEQDAEAWIALLGEYGQEVGTARDALQLAARFATNEPIRRKLVGALFLPARSQEGSDSGKDVGSAAPVEAAEVVDDSRDHDRDASAELLEAYLRDFPDGAIKRISINEDNPLEAMQRLAGPIPGEAAIDKQIQSGALPIGLAAEIYAKTYLEALLSREFGPVYTGTADVELDETALEAASSHGVIADLSAVVSIAKLPQELRSQITGQFANIRALIEHQRDAMNGNRLLRLDSGLSFRPARDDAPSSFEKRTPEQVSRTKAVAAVVEQTFTRLILDSHPAVTAVDALTDSDLNRPFLLALDHALECKLPLWVDDRPLAELIRSLGGLAFDTPALLHYMRTKADKSGELLDVAEAHLVAAGYTGIRYNAGVWQLAVSLAEDPTGLLSAIRFGGTESARDRLNFGMQQIDRRAGNPDELAQFLYALASWIISIAQNGEVERGNVRLLCASLLTRPWMTSSTLPYCIQALRRLDDFDAASILLREVYVWYEAVASRTDDQLAARVVFELISHLEPTDAFRIRAAVLARSFE